MRFQPRAGIRMLDMSGAQRDWHRPAGCFGALPLGKLFGIDDSRCIAHSSLPMRSSCARRRTGEPRLLQTPS